MESINWVSLLIAAIVPMAIGFPWYHKALFGKAWMDSIGMTEEKLQSGNMALIFGLSFVMSLVMAVFMFQFTNGHEGEYDSFQHGAAHGAILSLFIIVPIFISNGLFERKPWKNILINAGYWLVTISVMGGVMDAMNHLGDAAVG